jgi:hypothetical protein
MIYRNRGRKKPVWRRCSSKAAPNGPRNGEKHSVVDRMPDAGLGSGAYQFVVRTKRHSRTPVFSDARTRPDRKEHTRVG